MLEDENKNTNKKNKFSAQKRTRTEPNRNEPEPGAKARVEGREARVENIEAESRSESERVASAFKKLYFLWFSVFIYLSKWCFRGITKLRPSFIIRSFLL